MQNGFFCSAVPRIPQENSINCNHRHDFKDGKSTQRFRNRMRTDEEVDQSCQMQEREKKTFDSLRDSLNGKNKKGVKREKRRRGIVFFRKKD